MKKSYAKSLKEYEKPFELNTKKILAALRLRTTSGNKNMRLNHIHIKSKGPDKAIHFYQTYFKFDVFDKNNVEIYLKNLDGDMITISQREHDDSSLPSWFHFGFILTTKEQVKSLYHEMKKDELTFSRELTEFGDEGATFYVHDPDGNKIEISWIKRLLK